MPSPANYHLEGFILCDTSSQCPGRDLNGSSNEAFIMFVTKIVLCRGFGIVKFASQAHAAAAVEHFHDSQIGGRPVSVRIDRFA